MIGVRLQGRLGNQMFQISAARAHAARHGFRFVDPHPDQTLSDAIAQGLESYHEPSFHYRTIPKIDNIRLCGFFQSEKYFADHGDLIRSLWPSPIAMPGCCGIHIRRGDYVGNENYAQLTFDNYYERAIRALPEHEFYVIFSDDVEWCKAQHWVKWLGDRVRFSAYSDPKQDMAALAGCDSIIMANSSFSWWAAWLSGHNRIIAPEQWFAGPLAHYDTLDLIPDRWVRI